MSNLIRTTLVAAIIAQVEAVIAEMAPPSPRTAEEEEQDRCVERALALAKTHFSSDVYPKLRKVICAYRGKVDVFTTADLRGRFMVMSSNVNNHSYVLGVAVLVTDPDNRYAIGPNRGTEWGRGNHYDENYASDVKRAATVDEVRTWLNEFKENASGLSFDNLFPSAAALAYAAGDSTAE
ncbi:MAG: hypothetical protein BWY85_00122 [Firmicutes bacterium ADurb.Bin506]|nr:MAG: hypothetical protein BWY85_00122 [Firmicutes bacterium ADurb.Bin506]